MLNKPGIKIKTLGWLKAMLKQLSEEVVLKNATNMDEMLNINDLCLDSRNLQPGDVFVALSGFNVHGLDHAYQAERAGAIAVITEPTKNARSKFSGRMSELSIPVIECADLGLVLGELACAFYDHPSKKLNVTAITGTNGKTSTAWLLMHALEHLGKKAAYIGTLGVGGIDRLTKSHNTTPSAIAIQKHFAAMVVDGYEYVCIEVSSHALDQHRFNGTQVDQAVFTNLSREHLDYHLTMEAYAAAKLKLFKQFKPQVNIINADDSIGAAWLKDDLSTENALSYGIEHAADFKATAIELRTAGIAFDLNTGNKVYQFETALLGAFNVLNTLAVLAVLKELGYEPARLGEVVNNLQPVPGRMTRLNVAGASSNEALIVVDYAHTPDALLQVLRALRSHTANQLWCVFGCGGNRDRGKRAIMGEIAETHADQVVITDDNPRFESPAQIVSDIQENMQGKPVVIHDRKQAIAHALEHAQIGDIIVIAGKGHESTQESNGKLLPFNDMVVAEELLQVAS